MYSLYIIEVRLGRVFTKPYILQKGNKIVLRKSIRNVS